MTIDLDEDDERDTCGTGHARLSACDGISSSGRHVPQYRITAGRCASFRPTTRSSGCSTRSPASSFLLLGFLLILLIRWHLAWPTQPIPLIGALLGDARRAEGIMLPEFYTAARRDARHDHGVPGRRAARRRRVRQLPRPAHDRRARHGVSAAQRAELLAVPRRRPRDGRGLLPAGRRRQLRMDVVSAARRSSPRRARPRGSSACSLLDPVVARSARST